MTTWEDRMAAAAAARKTAEPPLPDPHASHHTHYVGSSTWCSCGKFKGTFSVALVDPMSADRPCPECGEPVSGWFEDDPP